jgi:SEC-C motif-containing protein
VKRGVRIVHGDKNLEELGRNDPCPCGSGRRAQRIPALVMEGLNEWIVQAFAFIDGPPAGASAAARSSTTGTGSIQPGRTASASAGVHSGIATS